MQKLLIGDSIYDCRLDCLREYVQNAIDATKVCLWKKLKENGFDSLNLETAILQMASLERLRDNPIPAPNQLCNLGINPVIPCACFQTGREILRGGCG